MTDTMENLNGVIEETKEIITEAEEVSDEVKETLPPTKGNEKPMTVDDLEVLSKYIQSQGAKEALTEEMKKVSEAKTELLGSITGLDSDKEFLSEKLKRFNTVEDLKKYLVSDKNVNDFFIDEETGESFDLSINVDSNEREMSFKRDFLVYLKTTDVATAEIDKAYEEMDSATVEMDKNINEVCNELSDNVLSYCAYLRDKADEIQDESTKKKVYEVTKYIKSGYDLSIYNEVLDEHPSVIKNTLKELGDMAGGVSMIGSRYTKKLSSNKIRVSLLPLLSNKPDIMSIEEQVLIRDDEYTTPDLFMYSIIRFYAMADWSNECIRKSHASIALVMKRLLTGQLSEEVKQDVLTAMVKYITRFK